MKERRGKERLGRREEKGEERKYKARRGRKTKG